MPNHKHNSNLTGNARALRKNMTKEERHLWYDFLRQKVIDNYIVDFYCRSANLVIELDGSQHFEEYGKEYDRIRSAFLAARGLTVIRIPNNEINSNFEGVCEYIDHVVKQTLQRPPC